MGAAIRLPQRSVVAASFILAAFAVSADSAATKEDRIHGAVLGALVSDSLSLGSHYEYDAIKIKQAYGGKSIDTLLAPGERMGGSTHGVGWGQRNYHPGQSAGGNTDYGLGNLFFLEYLAGKGKGKAFSIDSYVHDYWLDQYKGWQQGKCRACASWLDTMVKTVLSNMEKGVPLDRAGGMSNGQVVRFAASLGVEETEEGLVRVAKETTQFTNRNPQPIAASEFWARTVHRVINGAELEEAINAAAAATNDSFIAEKVKQAITKVKEATDESSSLSKEEFVDDLALTSMARLWDVGKTEPIKVGKASPTEGTLPGAIYFILKYKDFASAARANAMVGGDNASRSIPIGMVLGAYQGISGIPEHWVSAYKESNAVAGMVKQLPLFSK